MINAGTRIPSVSRNSGQDSITGDKTRESASALIKSDTLRRDCWSKSEKGWKLCTSSSSIGSFGKVQRCVSSFPCQPEKQNLTKKKKKKTQRKKCLDPRQRVSASIFHQWLMMRNKTADNLLQINLDTQSPSLFTHSKHIHLFFIFSALLHPLYFSTFVFFFIIISLRFFRLHLISFTDFLRDTPPMPRLLRWHKRFFVVPHKCLPSSPSDSSCALMTLFSTANNDAKSAFHPFTARPGLHPVCEVHVFWTGQLI